MHRSVTFTVCSYCQVTGRHFSLRGNIKTAITGQTQASTAIRVLYTNQGGTWWRSWLRYCATSRKVAGSIPDGFNGIFIDIILPDALGSTHPPNGNAYQEYFLGGKGYKHILRICVFTDFSTARMVSRPRPTLTFYEHWLSCSMFSLVNLSPVSTCVDFTCLNPSNHYLLTYSMEQSPS